MRLYNEIDDSSLLKTLFGKLQFSPIRTIANVLLGLCTLITTLQPIAFFAFLMVAMEDDSHALLVLYYYVGRLAHQLWD